MTVFNRNIKPGEVFKAEEGHVISALENGLVEVILETEEAIKQITTEKVVLDETNNDDTLENAKAKYEEKFGKPVANRYKNDLDYIINKINS